MPYLPLTNPQNIGIIVGRDLVGDALIKLPFVRALRAAWPEARIHWITTQGPTAFGGVLRNVTQHLINEIHEQPSWLPTTQKTPPREASPAAKPSLPHFDLLLDTRNRWREALLVRRNVPHGLFLAPAMRYLFSDRRPPLFQPRPPHMADRLLQLIELAIGFIPPATGRLPVPPETLAKARKILPEGPTYIGIAPGAGNAIKAWPRYKYEKLAAAQAARTDSYGGRIPVFILGPQELDWYEALIAAVPTAKFPLQDYEVWGSAVITIEQTLAIGSLLNIAVANDSGTGHMLAAVDCPLISLFGPTNPAKLAPRVTHGTVIKAQDFGSNNIGAIKWESVNEAIDQMLEQKR